MNPIFSRGPSIQLRLAIAVCFSVVLIGADHKFGAFDNMRVYLNSLVSPLQYLADAPSNSLNWIKQNMVSHEQLTEENQRLKEEILLQNEKLQRFDILEQENKRLKTLLGSEKSGDSKIMVAELMSVDRDPFSIQVVIDKGALNGVYEGQTVVDAKGIVGQVLQVGSTTSRVLLLSDVTHAIPVRILRTGVSAIAEGTGNLNRLSLSNVVHSADIRQGDVLVTSGLGGKFPQGYPVATVSYIDKDESRPFATVHAIPLAQLDRIRHILLLWPPESDNKPVHNALSELDKRLRKRS